MAVEVAGWTHLVGLQVLLQLQHLLQRLGHHGFPFLQKLLLGLAHAEAQPHIEWREAAGRGPGLRGPVPSSSMQETELESVGALRAGAFVSRLYNGAVWFPSLHWHLVVVRQRRERP